MVFEKVKMQRVFRIVILALIISLVAPVVSNAASDVTPPILNNLSVSKQEVTVGDKVKVTADVSDNLSGVERVSVKYEAPAGTSNKYVYLSLNSDTGKYESSFNIGEYDAAGHWKIDYITVRDKQDNYYYYYNSNGGSEYQRETSEYIDLSQYDVVIEETDKSAPVTSIDLTSSTPLKNEWYPSNVTAALSAADEESGIQKIEYRINEGDWIEYTDAFEISEEGKIQLDYRSVDHAGNVEEIQTETIKIDKTTPVTTTSEVPSEWGNEEVELSLSAKDESSGLKSIEYRINEGDWTAYSDPITIDHEGSTTIEYRSIDQAGNEEDIQSIVIKIDKTSPVTTASEIPVEWVNEEVELTLKAKDELSGPASIEYKLNDSDWNAYSGTVTLSKEGENVVEYRSIDKAGNEEDTKSLTFKLDFTAPETSISDVSDQWHGKSVEFALSATDSLTGVSKTEYRINDGDWTSYSTPVELEEEGTHKLEYRSFDKAGNVEDIQSKTIKIDTTSPVTSANGVPAEKWANIETEIALTAKDQLSGVSTIEYRINEGEWTDYSGSITLNQQGDNVIDYRSIDTAGNTEEIKSVTVKYDNNAPETSVNNVSDQWNNSEITLTLSSSDSLSGVAKTEYRINEEDWKEYTGSVVVEEEGNNTVDYRSVDHAGNVEEIKSINVKLDATSPETSMSSENQDTAVEVTLSSSDALSGVSKTEFRINQGEWQEYNTAILVTEEGTNTVDYRSVDNAGNMEEINSSEVTVEKPSNDVSFKDIEGHWAEEEINYLVEDNLLVGYDDGTFKPNVNITRAEAATVISRELELEKVVSDFPDVAEDHWASGYIGAATKAKILSGYNDGTFQPNENLSRAEMAIIVSRAYQLQGQTSIFTDTKEHWADSYIQTLAANHITVGYPDGTFRPEQEITRAEFASFVARVLEESFRPTEG
ncbi:S-layer homology domain-containing protein [Halobacillus sp. B29]|uniref:S-layer homology domain-containing protein n=1 Tax=Halobacillus sp. B29 TaxID=3457432 RepID=UPI003FCEBF21